MASLNWKIGGVNRDQIANEIATLADVPQVGTNGMGQGIPERRGNHGPSDT